MSHRARTSVSHDGIWAHRAVQPGRTPERGALVIPAGVLGPVSAHVELITENVTGRSPAPEREEEAEP